jgi:hypothetical protein
MTPRRFDAPASNTPARSVAARLYADAKASIDRIVSLTCLAVLLIRKDTAGFAAYRRRFRVDPHTFRRECRMLHRAGVYLVWYLTGDFRLYRFLAETEHE